jgi:FMN phosphatase YigB (HAD superfamily)
MISKTLLDLGNVIIKVDFQPFFVWLSTKGKFSNPSEYDFFVKSSLFYDFEFGQISRKDFHHRASQLLGLSVGVSEFEEKFCDIFPGYVDGIEEFFATFNEPLYCLSNTNEIHLDYLRKKFPLILSFHSLFSSYDLQKRKPYPGIYREVANRLDVSPERVIFFDDVMPNIEGAKKAGLKAHLFEDVGSMNSLIEAFVKNGR